MSDWILAAVTAILVWLAANGFHPTYLIGGAVGGLIRAVIAKTGTFKEKLLSGFVGAMLAGFVGPLLASLTLLSSMPASSIAFGIGLIGMYAVEGMIAIGKDWKDNPGKFRDDLRDFIVRVLGGSKDK